MSKIFDYYAILGVDPKAEATAIRIAFEALQNSFPPAERDRARNADYQRLVNAYEVLSDPVRRATYDSLLVETTMVDLDIALTLSRDNIEVSDTEQRLYLLVDIRPPKQSSGQQLPLNLCLVIDRSTSMQGRRLDAVRAAVELVIEKLTPSDVLSIVSFSDRAEVVASAQPLSHKPGILRGLHAIEASGGTEIYQGLAAGVKELRQSPLAEYSNHLILLTDGHTYGDDKQCLELAARTAVEGIGITAFGIGSDWNDQFLDQLVAPSGGPSGFIEQPKSVVQKLQERITGMGTVYAQNMRLQRSFPDFLSLEYGYKIVPFAQPLVLDDSVIRLGNVEGRSRLAFLLEMNIQPQTVERRLSIPINLVADIPARQMQQQTFNQNVRVNVLKNAQMQEPPEPIVEAVRMLNMYRMNERVWEEVEAGDLEAAARRMRHLTTRLLEAGEPQLARQANFEAERILQAGTMSLDGRKKLKFGTRALVTRTTYFDDDDND
ncbi:MAG: VWA domain-containing protein [Chloroflexi bacterium]|nr:VWA domain-containing protein [Ardenticatenaceae bacterium]MBL1127548.1 VWA domain-containing protein [Chloroflexota bacterium]NOG33613.1 VWA domain-containing protein [Chloroflexota bacterium]GIK56570.1 MAG: VWA domain-containing protein [Chloroflexota bacterium]